MHLAKSLTDTTSFLEQKITLVSDVTSCHTHLIGSKQ